MSGLDLDSDKDGKVLSFKEQGHGIRTGAPGCLRLVVQGKAIDYPGRADMNSLLEYRGENALYANVRINGEVLNRRDFENIDLHDGDNIDILYFMGGGGV